MTGRARSALGFARLLSRFAAGYTAFCVTSRTPHFAYDAMRQLYCRTDGRLNDAMAGLSALLHPPRRLGACEGMLGRIDEEQAARIAEDIRNDGFHVFPGRLPERTCDELLRFALERPSFPYTELGREPRKVVYERERRTSFKYEFEEADLLREPAVQRLVADPSMLAVAQAYLGTRPVLDLVSMWWSTSFSREASSTAAQLFHFDMDRLKFVKFFVYLTDVGPDNGPHVYVRGSVARKPRELLRDARVTDDEIARHYAAEDVIEIAGPRGTIFAADTRGLHKGKPLAAGDRLLLQFEFANSLFGQTYETVRLDGGIDETLAAALRERPRTYARIRC